MVCSAELTLNARPVMAEPWSLLIAATRDDDIEAVHKTWKAQSACVGARSEPGTFADIDVTPSTRSGTVALGMTRASPLRPGTPPQDAPRVMKDVWMDDEVLAVPADTYKLHRTNAEESGESPPPGFIVDTFAAVTIWRRYLLALHMVVKRGADSPDTATALASLRRVMDKVCGTRPVAARSVSCAMPCQVGWAAREHPTAWDLTHVTEDEAVVIDVEEGLFTPRQGFRDRDTVVHTLDPLEWWHFLSNPDDVEPWMETATSASTNTHWAAVTVSTDRVVVPGGPRNGAGTPQTAPGTPDAMSGAVLVEVRDSLAGRNATPACAATYAPLCLLARALAFVAARIRGMEVTADAVLAFHNASVDDDGDIVYSLAEEQVWLAPVPQQSGTRGTNTNICGVLTAATLLDVMVTGGRSSRHPASGLSFGDVAVVSPTGVEVRSTAMMRTIVLAAQTLGVVPGYGFQASTAQCTLLRRYRKAWRAFKARRARTVQRGMHTAHRPLGPASGKRKAID